MGGLQGPQITANSAANASGTNTGINRSPISPLMSAAQTTGVQTNVQAAGNLGLAACVQHQVFTASLLTALTHRSFVTFN